MKYLLHIVLFIRYRLFFFCCCCLLFSSCSNEGYFYPITPQPEKETQRIIIAYLAGDNSLSSEIEQKIAALTVGFLSADYSQNRLFIYYDRKHVSPQLLEISADTETPRQILKTYTTQNSASAEVMKQVLNDILKNYSASSYGLILFSHGSAWLPAGGLEEPYKGENLEKEDIDSSRRSTRSVCTDGESEMELTDFAAALPLPGNKKWDFILFEGCYMGSVEVAYELKDKTEAIIASPTEIVSPGMTEVYPSALPYLFQPTPGLEKFAQAYFNTWDSKTGDYRSATISVVRTGHLEELAQLARAAFLRWEPDAGTISVLQCFNRNEWHLFFDLKEALLTANPALSTYVDGLWKSIVTYSAATPSFLPGLAYGFTIHAHSGLSCYVPQGDFLYANQGYTQTAWCGTVYQ